jgi:hypothetical protein
MLAFSFSNGRIVNVCSVRVASNLEMKALFSGTQVPAVSHTAIADLTAMDPSFRYVLQRIKTWMAGM